MKRLLTNFMEDHTSESILRLFASLPDAIYVKSDSNVQNGFVYRPGPPGSILLVAHADTVWEDRPVNTKWYGSVCVSDKRFTGIGADDRAGCAALWYLRDKPVGLLITDGEEIGCLGASHVVAYASSLQLHAHSFLVEIDRRGKSGGVFFYDGTSSDEFLEFISGIFPKKWTYSEGSITDISVICPEIKRCGINLCAGYENEHTSSEYLNIDWLMMTINGLKDVICNGPRYTQFMPDAPVWAFDHWNSVLDNEHDEYDDDNDIVIGDFAIISRDNEVVGWVDMVHRSIIVNNLRYQHVVMEEDYNEWISNIS